MSDRASVLTLALSWVLGIPAVHAQEHDTADTHDSAARSARAGMFLPSTIAARTDSQTGFVRSIGGYDSAHRASQFEAIADVTLIGPLAVRVAAVYRETPERFRPSLGVRLQVLSQERQALDMGVGVFYRAEGFTEAEGEIELVLAFGRRFGDFASYANVVYGQDPEAAERDGELRLGALYAFTGKLQAGFDARLRVDLGSEEGKRRAEGGANYDLVVGPTASYALGPVAAITQAGLSVNGVSNARAGVVLLLGAAGAL